MHNPSSRPPIWFMRQAGRYLPEYRKLRQSFPSFFDFCYTPDAVTEATLQPVSRFNLDAAILFSDILVIPQAMGVPITFSPGEGPQVEHLTSISDIQRFNQSLSVLSENTQPVYQAVRQIRKELPQDKALIGFCGAPWTVASYLFDGHPSKDTLNLRRLAYAEPTPFQMVIDTLVEASVQYVSAQVEAGADVIMLFDSWAGAVPPSLIQKAVITPLKTISTELKKQHPDTPVIAFARNVTPTVLEQLAEEPSINGLGLSHTTNLKWACQKLQSKTTLQGNLDPALLLTNPETVRVATTEMLETAAVGNNYIANLGHGIHKETPIENVQAFVETVQSWKR
ncbi:MAG: uroporphyrinogen decarboxylase, partial [Alphaproteobacteria bacterium]|nr:uroporphyrinogen decarboxylase [Alphaproteobacteria bacterium]